MDPLIVKECIPGVKAFTPISEGKFRIEVAMRVGIVSTTYNGTMEISEVVPQSSYCIAVRGSGIRTNLTANGQIVLTPESEATNLSFKGDVQVTGVLARAGQRLMANVAQQQIGRFFSCLSDKIK